MKKILLSAGALLVLSTGAIAPLSLDAATLSPTKKVVSTDYRDGGKWLYSQKMTMLNNRGMIIGYFTVYYQPNGQIYNVWFKYNQQWMANAAGQKTQTITYRYSFDSKGKMIVSTWKGCDKVASKTETFSGTAKTIEQKNAMIKADYAKRYASLTNFS